jgi:hypothetical protein
VLTGLIGNVVTIQDVIATMRAIEAALPERDGVRWFNLLYRRVSEAVQADAASWADWPFLERFDVAFARFYFEAIVAWEADPARTPQAWQPLFQARHDAKVAPLQFALAGMNAHINNDLVIALDRLAQAEHAYPSRTGARYQDFQRVNDVLERIELELQPVLSTGVIGAIDLALGELDTVLAMWKVRNAREAAWTNGEVVWHLRAHLIFGGSIWPGWITWSDSRGAGCWRQDWGSPVSALPCSKGRQPSRTDPSDSCWCDLEPYRCDF